MADSPGGCRDTWQGVGGQDNENKETGEAFTLATGPFVGASTFIPWLNILDEQKVMREILPRNHSGNDFSEQC